MNLFHVIVSPHIETSKLIRIVNKFTGFYMMGNIGIKANFCHYWSHQKTCGKGE